MSESILSRYLDPEVLSRLAGRHLTPRGLVSGNLAGKHASPHSGFAIEFSGHREYVPGDDLRHVDWRVFYTRDKFVIKQYEMETNLNCHLVLDVSASMRYGDGDEQKLLYAARGATTLAHAVIAQNDRASLATIDDSVRGFIPPANSPAQTLRMTEHLDSLEPVGKTGMADCLMELSARYGRREIVIVFSDFFTDLERLEKAVQRLRYQQHEVLLFHVLHHDELAFEFDGPLKLVGIESSDEIRAQPQEIRAEYLAAIARFTRHLDEICQRNRAERVEVDTRRDLAEVLIDYLNHRSRLNRGR